MYTYNDHTFAICAYKENPYLEATIISLKSQTAKGDIILSTSTPNQHIEGLCDRYGIKLVINPHPHHAGDDWNYAYSSVTTPLVTIAHQDDIYEDSYLARMLERINAREQDDVIVAFSDYYELRNGQRIDTNDILAVKRKMNAPLLWPHAAGSRFIRQRILSFGDPICCPAATYVKENAGEDIFDTTFINSCDYKTFVDLSFLRGSFLYVPEKLVGHRIYEESATSRNIGNNIRVQEDQRILETFWPRRIAALINRSYSKSEKSNELQETEDR